VEDNVPNNNPELKIELPNTPNIDWQDIQFNFTGQWLPDIEAALIGPDNFAELVNLRYNDAGIEGVSGYTKYNTTALDSTSQVSKFDDIRTGLQLRTNRTTKSHVLVYAKNARETGRIYQNTTAVDGTQGNFDTTNELDVNGNTYFEDSAADLVGQFSLAPQNSAAFCNTKTNLIFSGFEHRLGGVFETTDDQGTNVVDKTIYANDAASDGANNVELVAELITNRTFEDNTTGWSADGTGAIARSATYAYGGDYALRITANADNGAKSNTFATAANTAYRFTFWVYSAETTVHVEADDGGGNNVRDTNYTIEANTWTRVSSTFTTTGGGAGSNGRLYIHSTGAGGVYYVDNVSVHQSGYSPEVQIMTTRPVQGFKFYIESAGGTAGTANVEYWDGDEWVDTTSQDYTSSDGHSSGGIAFVQTGWHHFDHTYSVAKQRHFQELYMYAYRLTYTGTSAVKINHITCDAGIQPLANIWDGVYRQPIQFQLKKNGEYEDYTLHVNQTSDLGAGIGAELKGVDSSDELYIMFEEQITGIRIKMYAEEVNTQAVSFDLYYWQGNSWNQLSKTSRNWNDGTESPKGNASFAKTGLLEWSSPGAEQPQTWFGTVGYLYKIDFSGAGQMGSTGADTGSVTVDTVVGIPANEEPLKAFDFPVLYKDRLMLGSFSDGAEGNRMDYSSISTPDVWNGFQSSDFGWQSLRFGGTEKLTCATQLFNRFGASIFAMLLVFKNTELYILTGDTPTDFQIFPVSRTVGCPAPYTLATAEVGLDVGEGLTRNIAVWVSHSGPMMFDGAVLLPIQGIDKYFDPNEQEFIEWDKMVNAQGWIDPVYKEYNLLLPAGQGEIKNNLWVVYDLRRKKWFRKHPGVGRYPQCAIPVMHTTGQQQVLGGFDNGYLQYLEKGTTWDGIGITQRVRTGDFWPSESIWDESLIRKFKLYAKKVQESDRDLSIYFYADTNADSGVAYNFTDSTATDMSFTDSTESDMAWAAATVANATLALDDSTLGLQKITRIVKDLNRLGWSHSIAFEATTNDSKKGFQPISWGMRYRIERKDDKAT
jgi:hypothetical protein